MTEASATWHDLCIHGHAHAGSECGTTPGGAPVRNVALPVLKRAYAVYCLGEPRCSLWPQWADPDGRQHTLTTTDGTPC